MAESSPYGRRQRLQTPQGGPTWLDHLSTRETVQQQAQDNWLRGTAVWIARILLFLSTVFAMIGFGPFLGGDGLSAQGNALRQLVFVVFACMAVPLVMLEWRRITLLLARVWSLVLVYATMLLTAVWSVYPSITVKRFFVYFIVLLVALGVTAILRTPKQFMVTVVAAFAFVLLGNFAYTVVQPGVAWSPIGLQAMHTSKNVAGMVSQAMAITFACAAIGVRHPAGFWAVIGLTLLALLFLALTVSKTALGLTLVCIFAFLPAYLLIWYSRTVAAVAVIVFVSIVSGIVFATGAFDLTGADWAEIVTGDPTFSARDQLWAAAEQHIGKAPWLGYGYGAQWSLLPIYHPLWNYLGFWNGVEENYLILRQFHNGYLDLVVTGGFLFAGVVTVFIVDVFAKIGRSIAKREPDRWSVAGNAWFAIYFVSVLFSNMMESSLFFPDMFLGQFLVVLVVAHASWQIKGQV
ncbi:O-antigen ligase family protein [Acuticoccus sp. MNP-M23]|uniref:O-antigen ligase family protein n=1 Tax=Acuticoccus sp. MNP-M23 TaxID=3072793 RepID=UPI0028152C33|nr:O-antigen ligase family protein [Acuticoccus sp. MNP-M23]WMS42903.1 O-antigen ligase family protein [Acuticoccus sp. MNP-M23]